MYLHIMSSENLKFYAIPIYLFIFGKKTQYPEEDIYLIKTQLYFSKDNTKKMLPPLDITQSVSLIIFAICTFTIKVVALIKNN